jgi:hypothetical protein
MYEFSTWLSTNKNARTSFPRLFLTNQNARLLPAVCSRPMGDFGAGLSVRLAGGHLAVVLQDPHQMVVIAGSGLLTLALSLLALRHCHLLQPLVLK